MSEQDPSETHFVEALLLYRATHSMTKIAAIVLDSPSFALAVYAVDPFALLADIFGVVDWRGGVGGGRGGGSE